MLNTIIIIAKQKFSLKKINNFHKEF
jgi:hypothetical protein